mgnify:CR=1 FL=1|tara:strand:- start:774 stop:908 length:135 start_codon:yes stop_codon:yes gene_type:complete
MEDIKEKIEHLKKQREAAKELFLKCQGGIEILTSMLEEKNEKKK